MSYDDARKTVYGMPHKEWQAKHQQEATPEQQQKYEATKPLHAVIAGLEK